MQEIPASLTDESPGDESAGIDPYKYRKRRRAIYAVLLGAFLAGLVALVIEMVDARRNPCKRVRDTICGKNATDPACKIYDGIMQDSRDDESKEMRGQIRAQCETKIKHMKEDDGITVP